MTTPTRDSLEAICREIEVVKLQKSLQAELTATQQERPSKDGFLTKLKHELEELKGQQEIKNQL